MDGAGARRFFFSSGFGERSYGDFAAIGSNSPLFTSPVAALMPSLDEQIAAKDFHSPSSALLPFIFFGWEGSPTKIDYRKQGTLILTALLEDLADLPLLLHFFPFWFAVLFLSTGNVIFLQGSEKSRREK